MRRVFLELVELLVFISIFDTYATYYLIQTGVCYEANPWLAKLITDYGYINSVGVLKFTLASVLVTLASTEQDPSMPVVLFISLITSAYICLLFWHLYLFSFTTRIL